MNVLPLMWVEVVVLIIRRCMCGATYAVECNWIRPILKLDADAQKVSVVSEWMMRRM